MAAKKQAKVKLVEGFTYYVLDHTFFVDEEVELDADSPVVAYIKELPNFEVDGKRKKVEAE